MPQLPKPGQDLFNRFQEAVRDGSVADVVRCLRGEGFPFDFVSPTLRRPSHLLCERGNLECVEELISLAGDAVDWNAHDAKHGSPLHYAAKSGVVPLVDRLLALGLPPSGLTPSTTPSDSDSETAFHWAVWSVKLDVAAILHAADPSLVNRRDTEGDTVLHWACFNGRVGVAKKLVRDFGADPRLANGSGSTPLHCAVQVGEAELVSFFVGLGVEVNAQDIHGDTPLHEAVSFEQGDLVEMLLRNSDVDSSVTNHNGQTPAHVATDLHIQHGIGPLLEAAAEGHDSFEHALATLKSNNAAKEAIAQAVAKVRAAGGY